MSHEVREPEPDIRPLGALALGAALLSAFFAISYFWSPLTYLAAALAVPLGLMSRGDRRIRAVGTASVIIAVLAILCATYVLLLGT